MWLESCFTKGQLIELEAEPLAGEDLSLQGSIVFCSFKLSILLVGFGDMLP